MKCLTQTLAALAGVLSVSIAQVAASAAAAQAVRAGGTGAALGLVEAVAVAYAASPGGQTIRVLPSLGSSGGLRALDAKAIDLALIARRLTPAETQAGLREAACLRTPYALVTSHHAPPPSLSQDDILRFYRDAAPAWPDGAKVKIILRPESEYANQLLAVMAPGIDPVLARARQRSEVPKATTDQDNADLAERTVGSLASMGLAQLKSERRALRALAIDGIAPSVEALDAGTYKAALDLCVVVEAARADAATGFVAFLRSEPGQAIVRRNDAFLLDAP